MTGQPLRSRLVWVPLTDYTESLDMAFAPIDFGKADDYDRTRWTRSGTNPNWSIGTVVE